MGSCPSCPAAEEQIDGDKLIKNVSGPRLFDLNMDEFHAGDFIIIVVLILIGLLVPFFWKAWIRWRRERRQEARLREQEELEFTVTSREEGRKKPIVVSPMKEKRFQAEPEVEC